MAVARESGLIVGQAISLDRGLETLQAVADTLPAAQGYASDGPAAYSEGIWPAGGQHILSLGKANTHTIESVNANLRTYLKRLARRNRCFSRSLEALRRAVRLIVYYYNQRQRLYSERFICADFGSSQNRCCSTISPHILPTSLEPILVHANS